MLFVHSSLQILLAEVEYMRVQIDEILASADDSKDRASLQRDVQ